MGKAARKKRAEKPHALPPASGYDRQPVSAPERFTRRDFVCAVVVAFSAFLVYWRTLCPTIYTSGAGENATAAATLGVPHPPGFPLFCLLGKLFTVLIPIGDAAYRVNLFSAACGAVGAGFFFLVLRFLGGIA